MTTAVKQPRDQGDEFPPPSLTPEEFRFVVGHLPTGVTVVTTRDANGRHGMTASSVTSLSLEPPMILACLNRSAPTTGIVAATGRFAINILGADQGDLARRFARPSADKFDGLAMADPVDEMPLLGDSLAHIVCDVAGTVDAGTHTVFLGMVRSASAFRGMPLTYFRGGFGKFQHERDERALELIRSKIIQGEYEADRSLDAASVAEEAGIDYAACYFALTRMLSDGLLTRHEHDSFTVAPFTADASDMTFDARCALELAALELGMESVSAQEIRELRACWEEMSTFLVEDSFLDFERYLDANNAFHASVIGLAKNPRISAAYAGLQIRTVMQRSFGSTPESSERFLRIQRQLLESIERQDLDGARNATRSYNQAAKARAREVLKALNVPHV